MIRVYYDNVIDSGRIRGDLDPPSELAAVQRIESAHAGGKLKRVTSTTSWKEQERTRDPALRATLGAARGQVSVVAEEHDVIRLSSPPWDLLFQALYDDLHALGLEPDDASHFTHAVFGACDWFVTLDPHFLSRRHALRVLCGSILVAKPSVLCRVLKL